MAKQKILDILGENARILVIDDQYINIRAMELLFEYTGVAIEGVDSGEKGLQRLLEF